MLGLNSTSEFPQKAADSMSDDKHSGRLRYVQLLKVTAALNMATTLDVVHHLQYLETVSETGSVDLVVSKLPVVATILDIVHHIRLKTPKMVWTLNLFPTLKCNEERKHLL